MTYSHDKDPDQLRFFVRRIDQRWHLTATGGGLEHTHRHSAPRGAQVECYQ